MTTGAARVWVTRAEPGASATADRLRGMGLEPMVAPLLTVEPTAGEIDLTGVAAVAFTSANGVRAFAGQSSRRDFLAYAVGDTTADAARAAGFGDVHSAAGDVAALAALIARERPNGVVLCPGAEERAGDLVGDLHKLGAEARAATLYRTVPADSPQPSELEDVKAILIHSPRAAFVVVGLGVDLRGMAVVGLSQACLKPLSRLRVNRSGVAAQPNEAALMDALSVALGISAGRR